jgi:hypothetical protein
MQTRNLNPEKTRELSPELPAALEPLLGAIESLSERIRKYNPADREHRHGKLPTSGLARTGEGSGDADRAYLPDPS